MNGQKQQTCTCKENQNVKAEKKLLKSAKGITLIALVITIIVLLILAGVTIAMLTGQNGILTNATNANSSSVYYGAEEQVKLAYMSVRTEIMAQKVANSTYNAQDNAGKLAKIVRDDLSGSEWNVVPASESATGEEITITYTNAKIYKDTIEKGKPSQNGQVVYTITLGAQSAGLEADGVTVATVSDTGNENNSNNNNNNNSGSTLPAGTYTAGQEIVYNGTSFELLTTTNANSGEHFFVLGDDGNSVRLLAKYCLNKAGTVQTDASAKYDLSGDAGYGRRFSSINYWKGKSGISYPCDLQTEERLAWMTDAETTANNAIKAAQSYGTSKGVEGRLMTYAEATGAGLSAITISTSNMTKIQRIILGKWTAEDIERATTDAPTQGFLHFWLGAARDNDEVWRVYGSNSRLSHGGCDISNYGVRPVLIVLES